MCVVKANECKEFSVVLMPNTIVQPNAVVVEILNALVAHGAMLDGFRDLLLANNAFVELSFVRLLHYFITWITSGHFYSEKHYSNRKAEVYN
jgi:hypothetical protein